MKVSRRSFIKSMALNSAAAAAATLFPGISFGAWKTTDAPSGMIQWQKTPCRFCGTGCGLLVGVSGERAVAVKGDPNCTVNKGLCCVKGYHSVQILYGDDRFKKAYVRKNGKLVESPLNEALDLVAQKMKETIDDHGKDAVAMYGSGQWSITDGYVASKLFKGCIGTNNVEANARLCMASAVTGFLTSFGLDEPMGCYDDLEHADAFVLWGSNMAEMHPILWSRLSDRRLTADHVRVAVLSTFHNRNFDLADLGGDHGGIRDLGNGEGRRHRDQYRTRAGCRTVCHREQVSHGRAVTKNGTFPGFRSFKPMEHHVHPTEGHRRRSACSAPNAHRSGPVCRGCAPCASSSGSRPSPASPPACPFR